MATKKHQIYFSSAQQDEQVARALYRSLQRFRVPGSLPVARHLRPLRKKRKFVGLRRRQGRDFVLPKSTVKQIRESNAMVLICSPSSSSSKWTRTELDAFYTANPGGKVIPVLIEGEPENSFDRNPVSQPAFPENLMPRDAERWIEGRSVEWEQTVPAEVLAELLEVPVAQISFHATKAYSGMASQRGFLVKAAIVVLALGALWNWKDSLNALGSEHIPGYAAQVAPHVEKLPSWKTVELPELPKVVVKEAAPKDAKPAAEAALVSQGVAAEPTRDALNSWMDRAEKLIPMAPQQSTTWLAATEKTLNSAPSAFGDERFRYHVLSAVAYKNAGNAETAHSHMLSAIEQWAALPEEQLAKKETLAFELLRRFGPTVEWKSSTLYIFNWVKDLGGDEEAFLGRAEQMIRCVQLNPTFFDPTDAWISGIVQRMEPKPEKPLYTEAKATLLRASLAAANRRDQAAVQLLAQGEARFRAGISYPGTDVEQGILAQFKLRDIQVKGETDARATAQIERLLPMLRKGVDEEAWRPWFQEDLAMAWDTYADYLFESQSYPASAEAYETASELWPEERSSDRRVESLLKAGCANRYSERHDEAWNVFRMALAVIPEDAHTANQITALRGASMAAATLKKDALARHFQERANSIVAENVPNYQPPSYWREPATTASN